METSDWFLFILTFVTGAFIGMFIYVTSFKPTYVPEDVNSDEDKAYEFSITGKTYGGLIAPEYIRPSFRLLGNGQYTYIRGGTGDNALEPEEGKLPRTIMNEINSEVTASQLAAASAPAEKDFCENYVDGTDYRYQITLDGTVYQLDTCFTDLTYESDLAAALEAVWQYLLDPSLNQSNAPQTPSDAAERFLRERLGADQE